MGNDKPGKDIKQPASSVALQSQYKSSFFTLTFFYLFIKVLSTQLNVIFNHKKTLTSNIFVLSNDLTCQDKST